MIAAGAKISSGGYGEIYQLANGMLIKKSLNPIITANVEKDKLDCVEGRGCKNDILLEGLVMSILAELKSEHFVKFEKIYKCGPQYYIVMENLGNKDCMPFTDYITKHKLSRQKRLSILFQITFALHLAHSKLSFVHGDLIGKNVMIKDVPREIKDYGVYGKIDNQGVRVILIDFGFSRLKYKGTRLYQTHRNPEWFANDTELFDGAADICKIYRNPNFAQDLLSPFKNLSTSINKCNSKEWSNVAVPPFPKINASDVLESTLFDEIKLNLNLTSSPPPSPLATKLKVLTLNVRDGFTHLTKNQIEKYMKSIYLKKPDFIFMQEGPGDEETYDFIKALGDYEIRSITEGANKKYENLMTLRYKNSEWQIGTPTEFYSGEKCYGLNKRVSTLQAAIHSASGNAILIGNVHLCGGRFDEEKVCKGNNPKFPVFSVENRKVNMLKEILEQTSQKKTWPSIILGDFNSDYNAYTDQNKEKLAYMMSLGCSQEEAEIWNYSPFELLTTHQYRSGITGKNKYTTNFKTLPDTIWYRSGQTVELTMDSNEILDNENKDFLYSDHHGVLSTFTFTD